MKKFSERSQTGQRRLMIVFGSLACVLLLATIFIFDKSGLGSIGSFVDGMKPDIQTPVPSPSPTPHIKPTEFPTITASVVPEVTQTPEITQKPGMVTAEDVLYDFLHYVLNEDYPYDGTFVSRKSLMAIAGIKELGKRISVGEVTPGDVGVFGENICICIGYDEQGLALFAYASPFSTELLKNGGIYVGYSMEQKDSMYCGMYPVPCEVYYDCADGKYTNVSLSEKSEKAKKALATGYTDDIYSLGRAVSSGDCDFVMDAFPEQVLKEYGLLYDDSFFISFLFKFNVRAGAEDAGSVYSFMQDGNAYRISKKVRCMDVKLVSLEAERYLSDYGNWTLEITEDYGLRLIPKFLLSDYAGIAFAKAADTVYRYDEEGNVIGMDYVEAEDKQGIIVEHEDGSKSYQGASYDITVDSDAVFVEPVKEATYFDLGNGKYLLVTENGVSFEYDLSQYADFPQEVIDMMIENKLEELNSRN